jgi:signal transduction histidine kinase
MEILLFNIIAPSLGYLSDRKKAEEKARTEAEHMARKQAESADRIKSDFLSIVSHELRTASGYPVSNKPIPSACPFVIPTPVKIL